MLRATAPGTAPDPMEPFCGNLTRALTPASTSARASLDLRFERRGTASVLAVNRHSGPFRVVRALHPEGPAVCHAIIVHPPGGMVRGDRIALAALADRDAMAVLTTPGAQKWYGGSGHPAAVSAALQVADGASMEWLPQEAIVFDGARVHQRLSIRLAPQARFFGWEMLVLGRAAMGETFTTGTIDQRIEFSTPERRLWVEWLRADADDRIFRSPVGLRGRRTMASAWAWLPGGARAAVEALRAAQQDDPVAGVEAGITCVEERLIVMKALGDAVEPVRALLARAWALMRPALNGLAPVEPRIWRT